MIASLDTLQTAKRLREVGFDQPPTEALTGVLRGAQEAGQAQLATKADVAALDAKIDGVAAELDQIEFRSEFALIRSKIEVLGGDLTIRLGSMIVVATGVLLAAKFFG